MAGTPTRDEEEAYGMAIARGTATLALAAAVGFASVPRHAGACSICRCGDPAFNALGLNIYEPDSFRLALDWGRFEKSQGLGPGAGTEGVVEDRVTATLSYSPSDAVTVIAQVPFASREITDTAAASGAASSTTGRGLGDPELYALVRVWAAPFASGLGRRAWVGLQLGVKTPWGANDLRESERRLDEHAQPGTGSTDWVAGASTVDVLDPSSSLFGSLQVRRTGANPFGYRYGNVVLANLGYERRLSGALDSALELNYRHAGEDRISDTGALDPNTGGGVLYLTPRLIFTLAGRLVARVSAQLPVARSLKGIQTERTVWGAGLTYIVGN